MVLPIVDPSRMKQRKDLMAAPILDLTLEIIYWITGEKVQRNIIVNRIFGSQPSQLHFLWRKMVLPIGDAPRVEQDRSHMAARILDLTLEIIYWITGEVRASRSHSSEDVVWGVCDPPRVSGGRSRTPSAITEPLPHSLIHEQKILELTHRITELLSGEVPIRCQDVTVYFSMEEWEYLEGHKDLYKDVMMENLQPLTSPDESSPRNPPERSPSPLCSQDPPEEKQNVPRDGTNGVFNVVTVEATPCGTTKGFGKPISQTTNGDNSKRNSKENVLLTLHVKVEDNESPIDDKRTEPKMDEISASSKCGKHLKNKSNLPSNKCSNKIVQSFSSSECVRHFHHQTLLAEHQKVHTNEKLFPCSECGKLFLYKSLLVIHQRAHTGEKPFSCSECGKQFTLKSQLNYHMRMHTGEKPFACSECGKCFRIKPYLAEHVRTHTGEKPFSCSECGKQFTLKSQLNYHMRMHTGEKPFACSECGKCFRLKPYLAEHVRTHTGEKPFSCSQCGKNFTQRYSLTQHQKQHTF
ncbi:uncharacterized protein LOC142290085 [Anomaloglossus baeobatrachus]|uniref:uncharacterized protein LOC142290085 n=1 Tax=Anomaloglossus baeobatrachus TaxID=238106 RepID=UPI003F5023BF